jgi:hypothetical protein
MGAPPAGEDASGDRRTTRGAEVRAVRRCGSSGQRLHSHDEHGFMVIAMLVSGSAQSGDPSAASLERLRHGGRPFDKLRANGRE